VSPSTWPTPVWLAGIVLLGLALFVASVREWRKYPTTPCTTCKGSGKAYQPGKGRRFYGLCPACGGGGGRARDGVRFFNWLSGRRDER
jgi:hypothetical protein